MPPLVEPLFHDGDPTARDQTARFFGERWALGFGGLLLTLLALTTLTHWLAPGTAFRLEKIVQQPVAPETSTYSSQSSEVTAPDPGDTLP